MDIWTAEKRSQVMAKVRSRGNLSTEVTLAKAFRRLGVTGWRRHLPVMAWHYEEYDGNKRLAEAENEARASKRGLWQESDPVPPWEWRRGRRE